MKTDVQFLIISRSVLLRMTAVSDRSCRENQNTHFIFNNFFFLNRPVYEIMWRNIVERSRPQIIWRMRSACWIPKATNTHSGYVILIVFPLQQWLHERTTVLHYTHCTVSVCLVDLQTIPHITFCSCIVDFQLRMQIAKPKRQNGNDMYRRHEH